MSDYNTGMQPIDAARATTTGFARVASHFMFAAETYAHGGELGLEGIDFYFIGRGGALGSVSGDVVAAAFVFFSPDTVRDAWERSRAVISPEDAAVEWAAAGHRWAEAKFPGDVDLERLAELTGRVVTEASASAAPIFAGWRRLPVPSTPAALALHHLNGLRELRGALHGAAVVAAGMSPLEAVMVKTPFMAQIFGWSEPYPDVSALNEAWEQAEEGTNRAIARALAPLTDKERIELTELVGSVDAAIAG